MSSCTGLQIHTRNDHQPGGQGVHTWTDMSWFFTWGIAVRQMGSWHVPWICEFLFTCITFHVSQFFQRSSFHTVGIGFVHGYKPNLPEPFSALLLTLSNMHLCNRGITDIAKDFQDFIIMFRTSRLANKGVGGKTSQVPVFQQLQ